MVKHPSRNRIIRHVDDLPSNHWMARQLPKGTSLRRYAEDRAISLITRQIQQALAEVEMSRTDAANVLGTTKSYVSQVLNGSTNMTLKTLGAMLWAAGRQVTALQTAPIGFEAHASAAPVAAFRATATASGSAATLIPNGGFGVVVGSHNSSVGVSWGYAS